jgi:hypothetical protein
MHHKGGIEMKSTNLHLTFPIITIMLLLASAAHGQDLNATLNGTYAVNTNWGCTDFNPDFAGTNGTVQVTSSGLISYYGNGTAAEMGRY